MPKVQPGDVSGEQLRAWREAAGMTQKEAADMLAVNLCTVSRWENGVRRIPKAAAELAKLTIKKIAAAGVSSG